MRAQAADAVALRALTFALEHRPATNELPVFTVAASKEFMLRR